MDDKTKTLLDLHLWQMEMLNSSACGAPLSSKPDSATAYWACYNDWRNTAPLKVRWQHLRAIGM